MTDIAAVRDELAAFATQVMYPVVPPVAGQCVLGFDVQIGTGWPTELELATALGQGRGFISVYPIAGERDTTRFETSEIEVARTAPGISGTIVNETITFGGAATAFDAIGVVVANVAYTFNPSSGDTAAQVAAAVSAAIPASAVVGASVSFASVPTLIISTNGQSVKNIGNTERRIQLTIWARDTPSRDAIGLALETAIRTTNFLYVGAADEAVRIWYDHSMFEDRPQDAGGYKRILVVKVDYPFTVYKTAYAILFTSGNLPGIQGGPTLANGA